MPDDAERQKTEGEMEAEMAAQMGRGGLLSRLGAKHYAALGLGAFALSALIALIAGGHFAREPLCRLRAVPLLGRLVPAPPQAESEGMAEAVPTVAAVHPMAATEISELAENLQKAREQFAARQAELGRDEERLRALQLDLAGERDRLDQLMAALTQRQQEVQTAREALDADALVVRNEERKRLLKLAKIYEAQSPASAAAELEALDRTDKDGTAAKILAQIQEKKAAAIFDVMKPEAALKLKSRIPLLRDEPPAAKEATP